MVVDDKALSKSWEKCYINPLFIFIMLFLILISLNRLLSLISFVSFNILQEYYISCHVLFFSHQISGSVSLSKCATRVIKYNMFSASKTQQRKDGKFPFSAACTFLDKP